MGEKGKKILVVDDDRDMRMTLFESLSAKGFELVMAESGHMAMDILRKGGVDLLISDVKMPGMDGLELLQKVKVLTPDLPVLMITAFATVDSAVEAMKRGAVDYILKPFPVEVIEETVARVFRSVTKVLPRSGAAAPTAPSRGGPEAERPVIGREPAWRKIMARAKAVASSTATVLILGESGTGKEVLARYIHRVGNRSRGPFVALNCAALPDGLLESELFGHEKGAFTGAVAVKKGKFELAHGGTLLLDEIGEVPLHLQAKLLRVLQEQEVDRLGGKTPVKFDVHVLATTNRNLSEAVEKGEFRQDLFYRLNVIPLRLPSLRELKSDILELARYFIEKYSRQYNREVKDLSPLSRQRFLEYPWPGNGREMENMIERAVLLSAGEALEPWDLWDEEDACSRPSATASPADAAEEGRGGVAEGRVLSLREAERQMIMQALQQTDNNRTHAAKMLGISVRTLRNKLHEYRNRGFSV